MKKAVLALASNTYAIKARRVLSTAGIEARIVKIDNNKTSGCSFGIEINYTDYYGAIGTLREKGITYSPVP